MAKVEGKAAICGHDGGKIGDAAGPVYLPSGVRTPIHASRTC